MLLLLKSTAFPGVSLIILTFLYRGIVGIISTIKWDDIHEHTFEISFFMWNLIINSNLRWVTYKLIMIPGALLSTVYDNNPFEHMQQWLVSEKMWKSQVLIKKNPNHPQDMDISPCFLPILTEKGNSSEVISRTSDDWFIGLKDIIQVFWYFFPLYMAWI